MLIDAEVDEATERASSALEPSTIAVITDLPRP